LADIDRARRDLPGSFASLPQVLLGHSMGGNLVVNYALRRAEFSPDQRDPEGLVLASPMLLPPSPPPRPQIFAAWLTGHLLPRLRVHRKVQASRLTGDPSQIAAITADPQMHASITVHLATQLLSQGRWAIDHARELRLPSLLMFGEQDDLVDLAACEHLPIRAGETMTLVRWPGKRHAIFHDQPGGEVSQCLVQWLTRFSGSLGSVAHSIRFPAR
jgi:alpha-beta hydrolase superfamily lysophospholipase